MRYFYAQIDEDGFCVAVLNTHAPIESPLMVAMEAYDSSFIGRQFVDGAWL